MALHKVINHFIPIKGIHNTYNYEEIETLNIFQINNIHDINKNYLSNKIISFNDKLDIDNLKEYKCFRCDFKSNKSNIENHFKQITFCRRGITCSYTDAEIKMLRVIKRLKENFEIPIKATFLGAHAFPAEYKNNHQAYIDLIINEMLPAIQKENLADYIDVFCEDGFFNAEETNQILKAGALHGLKAKIHANQLNYSGGIQVGVANNAISVDHLECVGAEEIDALKNSNTIGTILPSAAFFLGIAYQPARKMIDANLALALASDYNPGSSPSGNMPFIMALACTQLKMTPEEAFNALTFNAAHAMELASELGSITIGKKANLIITKAIPSLAFIPYAFGSNLIDQVLINGKKYE